MSLTILEVANEMYARGINFLPIDLYKSDASKFQIIKDGIRPPLNALQGIRYCCGSEYRRSKGTRGVFI